MRPLGKYLGSKSSWLHMRPPGIYLGVPSLPSCICNLYVDVIVQSLAGYITCVIYVDSKARPRWLGSKLAGCITVHDIAANT